MNKPRRHCQTSRSSVCSASCARCAAKAVSVIYITHRLGEVFEICDSVTVLRNGEHVGTNPIIQGITRDQLIADMLGRSFAEIYPREAAVISH